MEPAGAYGHAALLLVVGAVLHYWSNVHVEEC